MFDCITAVVVVVSCGPWPLLSNTKILSLLVAMTLAPTFWPVMIATLAPPTNGGLLAPPPIPVASLVLLPMTRATPVPPSAKELPFPPHTKAASLAI